MKIFLLFLCDKKFNKKNETKAIMWTNKTVERTFVDIDIDRECRPASDAIWLHTCARVALPTPELFTRLNAEVNWLPAKPYTNFIKQSFHNNTFDRVKRGQVRKRQLGNCLSHCSSFSIVVTAERVDRFYNVCINALKNTEV